MRPSAAVASVCIALGAVFGCSETKPPPIAPPDKLADSADQVIFGARQLLTNRGLLRAELHADTAFSFNEGTRIELRNVNTTFFSATGAKNATLTSREGTYNTQIGQMSARKDVVVVTEDGRRLTTPDLRFNEQTNLIASDSSFVVSDATRRLQGIGFESDPEMNNVKCKAACRGEAGTVGTPASGPGGPTQSTGALPQAGSRPGTFRLPGQPVVGAPAAAPVARPTPAITPPVAAPSTPAPSTTAPAPVRTPPVLPIPAPPTVPPDSSRPPVPPDVSW